MNTLNSKSLTTNGGLGPRARKKSRPGRWAFACFRTRFALQKQFGMADTSKGISLFNKSHSFKLTKSKTAPLKWVLGNIQERGSDEVVNNLITYVKMSIAISNTRLLDMVDSELFEFSNWDASKSGVVTCRIMFKSPDSNSRLYDYVDVSFDANNHHRITRTLGTRQVEGGKRTTENVYVYDNLNVPVRVTSKYAGAGEPATIEFLFTELSVEPRPESEFTLSESIIA